MRLTVLVPTYRRPYDLTRCLEALAAQARVPDELLVIHRADDEETIATLDPWHGGRLPLHTVVVDRPGQVQALNAGLAHVTGDVVAITDDDAAPRTEWLERIEAHFAADAGLGAVGGRDWIHRADIIEEGIRTQVGQIQWFGRLVGNHHMGVGVARPVRFLKGANMSYRREAIDGLSFDEGLRGHGAQVHNDLAFSLAVGKRGWSLLYDPLVAVDHYPAERPTDYQREEFHSEAVENEAYNYIRALKQGLPPWRFGIALSWRFLIGTASVPGVFGLLRSLSRSDPHALPRWRAAIRGFADAIHMRVGGSRPVL